MNSLSLPSLALAATLLAGCASGPKFAGVSPPAAGKSVLYVYRPAALPQAVNTYTTLIDPGLQWPVDLKNGSWARVELEPGRYTLRAHGQVMHMVCSATSVDAVAGRVHFVALRVTMRGNGHTNEQACALTPVGEPDAVAALQGLAQVP